jgi:hypothetical protein
MRPSSNPTCSVPGCARKTHAKGLCRTHGERVRKHGELRLNDPIRRKAPNGSHPICEVAGCGKQSKGRFCSVHYHRYVRHGDPLGGSTTFKGDAQSFIEKAVRWNSDNCLIWPFYRSPNGYAQATINGRPRSVHKYVCERVNGKPKRGMEAAHTCENGSGGCVGGSHLEWQTHAQNMSTAKMRKGEQHHNAKLTIAQVNKIRSSTKAVSVLSNEYGVSKRHILRIKHRNSWR